MAQITITIPDGDVNDVYDAIAARHNYDAAKDGTKAAFTKTVLIRLLKDEVRGYEVTQATATAARDASATVDAISIT